MSSYNRATCAYTIVKIYFKSVKKEMNMEIKKPAQEEIKIDMTTSLQKMEEKIMKVKQRMEEKVVAIQKKRKEVYI